MRSPSILLIQTGSAIESLLNCEGDLPKWYQRALGVQEEDMEVVQVFNGETLPAVGQHRVAVITGSGAMVSHRHAWSERTAEWIRQAMAQDMPMFGVCYGHQLIAHALGGVVDDHPKGLEIGCLEVALHAQASNDPLLQPLPPTFLAHLTHFQSVLRLPPAALALAHSAHDAHQIVRYGPHAVSTQFHPEFTPRISGAYLQHRASVVAAQGQDGEALQAGLTTTPEAQSVLKTFVNRYTA